MLEIAVVLLLQAATISVLAMRLHRIDPDLTAWQYFKRIARAQNRLGTLLMGSRDDLQWARKPDGTPITPAFVSSVAIAVGCGFAYILVAVALIMMSGRG